MSGLCLSSVFVSHIVLSEYDVFLKLRTHLKIFVLELGIVKFVVGKVRVLGTFDLSSEAI